MYFGKECGEGGSCEGGLAGGGACSDGAALFGWRGIFALPQEACVPPAFLCHSPQLFITIQFLLLLGDRFSVWPDCRELSELRLFCLLSVGFKGVCHRD